MELIIDNYDSFTYNLYQYMGTLNPDIQVIRNDAITVEGIRKLQPDHLILSPGPGRPCDAGVCEPALRELKGEFPSWGCAWAIRPSEKCSEAPLPTPGS